MDTENITETWKKDVNQALTTVAGSLSICGTILIFISFALWKEMRTTARKILVFISIGDLLTAMVNVSGVWMHFVEPLDREIICKIQSFINIASILSSFFWTVFLSFFLFLSLRGMLSEVERKLMLVFHVTAWGIPLSVATIAASFGNVFGHTNISDGWCWISFKLPSNMMLFWMLFAGKGWEMLSYIAITFFYIKAKLVLKRKVRSMSSTTPFLTTAALVAARRADRKFTFIPLVFILLRIWGTIRFLHYASCLPECQGKGPQNFWLVILHGIGDSSQGFANFVIFCLFTDKIRYKVRFWFNKVCPSCMDTSVNYDSHYNNYESTNDAES